MWLPKDERRLLRAYYVKIGELDREYEFFYDDLLRFIKSKESSRNAPTDDAQEIERYRLWLKDCNRIVIANETLKKRGLIVSSVDGFEPSQAVRISLALTGYDFGRKYDSWKTSIVEWIKEYWLIVTLLCSAAGFLVNWFSG